MVKPELPSAYDLVVLPGERDPFERACRLARAQPADGLLVWADRADRLALAVVLAPDRPLHETLLVYHVFTVAAGDALGGLAAPAYPLTVRWPDRILFDGFELARLRCAWPRTPARGVPGWLVLGLEAEIQEPEESGLTADRITLTAAGAGEVAPAHFVESVARQFLYWLQRFEEQGFEPVRRAWNHRLERRGEIRTLRAGKLEVTGAVAGLDGAGCLEVGDRRLALVDLGWEQSP